MDFTKGITGVVGPNGCGKTNIVDGIRWVLGEQKSSTLRSDKMENVIFNGTRNKKPMGMAEVSLTLINDLGILPSEYSEVTITRRIFRSGESEYLLNKNICRLKDITNLFMDTGMGTNAYSVIELKMIETILSNKADERRHMFEEAAGVNKYKLRRRLALKKLDEVKTDLVRVNDIVAEVEKNVRSLERQAKKADKYNQIQSILREKELSLSEREFSYSTEKKSDFEATKRTLDNEKDLTDQNIRTVENELINLRNNIREIESKLNEKREEITSKSEIIYDFQKDLSVAEERSRSLEINIERYNDELLELEVQNTESDNQIDQNNSEIISLNQKIDSKKDIISAFEATLGSKIERLGAKKEELREKNERSVHFSKKVGSLEHQINSKKGDVSKVNSEIEKLNEAIQKSTNNIAKTVGFLEELALERDDAQRKVEETDSLLAVKQKEKENLEKELTKLKSSELDQKNIISSLKNKVDLIQTMITNLEGISDGSRILIQSEEWTNKDKTLFADVGNADDEYRYALEAALKTVLNNLLIENFDDLSEAIKYLKKNDLGKASFYLLKQPNKLQKSFTEKIYSFSVKWKGKKLEKEDGFINWASRLVKADDKWRPYFEKVLNRTAVTKDVKSAIELFKKFPSFSFATLDGDLVKSDGIVEAGSSPKLSETLFGRKQVLDDLKTELPRNEENLINLQKLIRETEDKLNNINLKDFSDQGRTLLNEVTNIDKQISQFEFEKNKYSEDIDNTQNRIRQFAVESNSLDDELSALENEIESLRNEEIQANEELAKVETELKHIEHEFNESVENNNREKLENERLTGQLTNKINDISRLEQTKDKIAESKKKRENDISDTGEEINSIKDRIEEIQSNYDEKIAEKQSLVEEETVIKEKLDSIKSKASGFDTELNGYRNKRQEISDTAHSADIKISELSMKLENIVNHIKEEYGVDLEYKQFEDLENFDFRGLNEEVHENKQKLKSLGPINLLAYSEYEEENERLEFLLTQRNDLVDSEKDLIKTIEEINTAAETMFVETFEKIRDNFKRIFGTLFDPGDEADLVLEEGADPLEGKIEIMAKPKGKRPTSIELLSGGEKTLTATALLFAIYLVKPSPFCILDEVDAPLDDANIDRFTKLIKEFSNNTQFIIVTHNKRTMTSAANMYGITMQEEGISKLAGVQFNEELNLN